MGALSSFLVPSSFDFCSGGVGAGFLIGTNALRISGSGPPELGVREDSLPLSLGLLGGVTLAGLKTVVGGVVECTDLGAENSGSVV